MELSNSAMGRTFPQKLSCGQPAQRHIQSWRRFLVRKSAAESALTNLWKCPVGREYGPSAIVLRYRIRERKNHIHLLRSTPCVKAAFLPGISRRAFVEARKNRSCFQPSVSSRPSASAPASRKSSDLIFQVL